MNVCPKAVKTLKPPINKIPTIAVAAASSFFNLNGCLSRREVIASNDAAVVNKIALIESGSISTKRNLIVGQFKPNKIPINRNVIIFIKLYFVFKEILQRVFRFFIKVFSR